MTNRTVLAVALLAASGALLSACSPSGETPAEHSSADRAEGHTSSSAGIPAGNADAGAQLAQAKNAKTGQACVDCHGAAGNAPIDPTYPKLGGQYHDYIAQALQKYRDGERQHALMAAQAADLSDQQIADLSAYFGAQPSQLRDLSDL